MKRNNIAALFCSTVILAGCGGGGGDADVITPKAKLNATVIDGYLKDATVWLDVNKNFELDDNEPFAISGSAGKVAIDVTGIENPSAYPLVAQAEKGKTVDESTGNFVTHNFVMSAPQGERSITPLSTLVHLHLAQNTNTDEFSVKLSEAKNAVAASLGLDKDDILGDYIEGSKDDVLYAAENIVASGLLPEEASELKNISNKSTGHSEFTDNISSVNEVIKQLIEHVNSNDEISFDDQAAMYKPVDQNNECGTGFVQDGIICIIDSDKDGLPDTAEQAQGTNPFLADTDGDNISDKNDIDPLNYHLTTDSISDNICGDNNGFWYNKICNLEAKQIHYQFVSMFSAAIHHGSKTQTPFDNVTADKQSAVAGTPITGSAVAGTIINGEENHQYQWTLPDVDEEICFNIDNGYMDVGCAGKNLIQYSAQFETEQFIFDTGYLGGTCYFVRYQNQDLTLSKDISTCESNLEADPRNRYVQLDSKDFNASDKYTFFVSSSSTFTDHVMKFPDVKLPTTRKTDNVKVVIKPAELEFSYDVFCADGTLNNHACTVDSSLYGFVINPFVDPTIPLLIEPIDPDNFKNNPTLTSPKGTNDLSGGSANITVDAKDIDGDALTYQWIQIGGTKVELASETPNKVTFDTSFLEMTEDLTFEVLVRDGTGGFSTGLHTVRFSATK